MTVRQLLDPETGISSIELSEWGAYFQMVAFRRKMEAARGSL